MEKNLKDNKDENTAKLELEIEELETKIAPALTANHNETLVRDI